MAETATGEGCRRRRSCARGATFEASWLLENPSQQIDQQSLFLRRQPPERIGWRGQPLDQNGAHAFAGGRQTQDLDASIGWGGLTGDEPASEAEAGDEPKESGAEPPAVSYTHLTLPTILRV